MPLSRRLCGLYLVLSEENEIADDCADEDISEQAGRCEHCGDAL